MAAALDTIDPGHVGLTVDGDTVLLVELDEAPGVWARDVSGHLEDFPLSIVPERDVRSWASATALQLEGEAPLSWRTTDKAGQSAVLTRDVSVQWIGVIDLAAVTFGVIARRGIGSSSDERTSWCVYVDTDSNAPNVTLGMLWQDASFADHGATAVVPLVDGVTLWTVTRRWESPTRVVVRFFVGDRLWLEQVVAAGDIGGTTVATTELFGGDGVGGAIDTVRVVSREISPEEVQQTWARMTRHQPDGAAAWRATAPPGAPWFRDPSSAPARLARVAGEAVGLAIAKAEEVRETWLPSAANRDTIARWEAILRARTSPRDSLDARRARIVGRLPRDNGYAPPQVQELLAESFDLDAVDVALIEFSADVAEPFTSIIDERRWLVRQRAASAWTVLTKRARAQATTGTDLRYEPGEVNAPTIEMAVVVARNSYSAMRVTPTLLPADAEAGLLLRQAQRGDRLFFGVRNTAGTYQVVYQRWRDGVLVDASPVVLATTSNTAHWLRVRAGYGPPALVGADEMHLQLEWSTDGTTWSTQGAVLFVASYHWVGCYARGTDAALASTLDVLYDKIVHREHDGVRAFCWYAYRDPGLGGTPNMAEAQALVVGVKPAHTHAAAITSLDVLCDNAGSGCDRGPLGAL